MKKLERTQMKNLKGGIALPYIPGLLGYRGGASNGFCFCDFYNTACPGNICCEVSCPVSMCTPGSIDPNPPGVA
jgi:hypothetical protein